MDSSGPARTASLRRAPFAPLFLGSAVSALGDRLAPVALAFVVLDLTRSPTDLGLVLAAQSLPLVLFVLLGGVWADRLPRRRVMLASDLVRATAQGTSAILVLGGTAPLWALILLQATYGAAQAFFEPAAVAIVPQTVDPVDLQRANALLEVSGNVAWVLGPALAGVVVVALGPGAGLAIDALTFLVSAACLTLVRVQSVSRAPKGSTIEELRAGWRAFRSRTWLWVTVALFTVVVAAAFSPMLVLGPEVAKTSLGGSGAWAAISAARGLGAIVGAGLGMRWEPRRPLRAAFLTLLLFGPPLLAMLAAHAPLGVILAYAVFNGAAVTLFSVLWVTALQRSVPPGELSRVCSWDYVASLALQPVGYAVSGPLAAALGLSTVLAGAGCIFLVAMLVGLAVPAIRTFTSRSPGPMRLLLREEPAV